MLLSLTPPPPHTDGLPPGQRPPAGWAGSGWSSQSWGEAGATPGPRGRGAWKWVCRAFAESGLAGRGVLPPLLTHRPRHLTAARLPVLCTRKGACRTPRAKPGARCAPWPGCEGQPNPGGRRLGEAARPRGSSCPAPTGRDLSTQNTLPAPVAAPQPVKALRAHLTWHRHVLLPGCAGPARRPRLPRQSHSGSFPWSPVFTDPGVVTWPCPQPHARSHAVTQGLVQEPRSRPGGGGHSSERPGAAAAPPAQAGAGPGPHPSVGTGVGTTDVGITRTELGITRTERAAPSAVRVQLGGGAGRARRASYLNSLVLARAGAADRLRDLARPRIGGPSTASSSPWQAAQR